MVITRTVEMHAQLVGYDFKKKGLPTDKNIAVENSKVSNDYFWKTNKYTDQDVFGRTLDLTALINKPDGYLKGSLSDTEDVDYYEFNITEYRALSFAKDTCVSPALTRAAARLIWNLSIQITFLSLIIINQIKFDVNTKINFFLTFC